MTTRRGYSRRRDDGASGWCLGGLGAEFGQRGQAAQHAMEELRFASDKLEAAAVSKISLRVQPFELPPKPALHALEIEGAAGAGIGGLRRSKGEPFILHKNPVVHLWRVGSEDVPLVKDLKWNGGDVFADGDVHGAAINAPAAAQLFGCRLQRTRVKRGDHDMFIGGYRRTKVEYVVDFMRGGFQPTIVAMNTVKHIPSQNLKP